MTIREWKTEMTELINDFQLATDIDRLEELVEAIKVLKAQQKH